MSLIADQKPGDWERLFWRDIPQQLEGRQVSLDELQMLFPEDDEWGQVEAVGYGRSEGFMAITEVSENTDFKGWVIYGRTKKEDKPLDQRTVRRVGYLCGICDKLIIGSPTIKDEDSITGGAPLSGRIGYDVSCANQTCLTRFYQQIDVMS